MFGRKETPAEYQARKDRNARQAAEYQQRQYEYQQRQAEKQQRQQQREANKSLTVVVFANPGEDRASLETTLRSSLNNSLAQLNWNLRGDTVFLVFRSQADVLSAATKLKTLLSFKGKKLNYKLSDKSLQSTHEKEHGDFDVELLNWRSSEPPMIPQHFASVSQYREVFRPLLLLEAAEVLSQGIAAGEIIEYRLRRLNNPKQQPQGKCKSRVQYQPVVGDQDFLRPGDVLITKTTNQIALVHGADEKSATVVSLTELPEACDAVHCGSILSLRRSYESLASLEGDCAQSLILENALALRALEPSTSVPEGLNPSQHRAIENVLDGRGMLYLIQGPPGTGKTTTVCKLIARILDTYPTAKLLVSAPSNRAVHELIDRLPPRGDLPMIFFGVKEKITSQPVKDIFAEEFPQRASQLLGEVERAKGKQLLEKARALHDIFQRWNLVRLPPEDVGELPAWIAEVREYFRGSNLLSDVLSRSSIVFLTLSTAGRRQLQELLVTQKFHYLIVDEAGQALDPELLIPMYCNPDRIILVGDVQQLGPTIVSQKAQKAGLNRSAMLRLQESQTQTFPVFLLDTQYRMDPKISYVSNHLFYGGKLRDAEATTRRVALPGLPLFRDHPFIWVNVAGKETPMDYSYQNLTEQALCIALVQYFFGQGIRDVGIISPYALQVAGIKEALASKSLSCPVASVDGFQGGEKDVVIISLVRTRGIGFVNHPQRLNVGITRAKRLLLVIGDKRNFEADPLFDRILKCPNVHEVSGQDVRDDLKTRKTESAEEGVSPQSKPSAPRKKKQWRCPCGAENWPNRVECFTCRQARLQ